MMSFAMSKSAKDIFDGVISRIRTGALTRNGDSEERSQGDVCEGDRARKKKKGGGRSHKDGNE